MKKLLIAIAISGLACSSSFGQAPDAKLDWAARVVSLQQGPELQRLVAQLAESASQEVLQNWAPKLQSNVAQASREKAGEALNIELKAYYDDVTKIINSKVIQTSNSALVPAYAERFSLDELKQIATFFESPVIKKYQAEAPELGSAFIKELVEATRADVTARVRQFDDKAATIVGAAPAAGSRSAPATAGAAKAPAKK